MEFTIITGMSGAGKSQVVKYMEDLGYYCVDNMPPMLLPKFAELCDRSTGKLEKIAVVLDIRGGEFFDALMQNLQEIETLGYHYEILFLDASDQELIRRFKETRRMHPLAKNESSEGIIQSLESGIKEEREKLRNLRQMAKNIIDTTGLSVKALKEEVREIFIQGEQGRNLTISITSFGFKYGIPLDADLVFDVRFLPNPFYVQELKELTGDDPRVQEYVMQSETSETFYRKLVDLMEFLMPNYVDEGKNHLVVSIGCTGGKHRSVTIANRLFFDLEQHGYRMSIHHRDKDRSNKGV